MAKVLNFSVQVSDEEFAGFMERMSARGALADDGEGNGTPAPAGTLVDKNGAPWIEAVHSANKSLNDDGSWRGKRGVDKTTRAAYENQAKLVGSGQAQPSAGIPAATAPIAPPLSAMAPSAFPPIAPTAAFPPVVAAVVAAVAPAPVTYEDVAGKFQAAVAAGRMQPAQFADWYGEMGINDPAQLATNETARAVAMRKLKEIMGEA